MRALVIEPLSTTKWEERAAIMEHDGGLSRQNAEYQAAERLHLLAFLDIRAGARSGNRGG